MRQRYGERFSQERSIGGKSWTKVRIELDERAKYGYLCPKKSAVKAKHILPFSWQDELANIEKDSIDNEFILLNKPVITSSFRYPWKMDATIVALCTRGAMRGRINLQRYDTAPPCFIVILPGQILELESEHISGDFEGRFIVMSRQFSDSLFVDIQERLPLFLSVQENPIVALTPEELGAMLTFYSGLRNAVRMKDNPHRLNVVRHIIMAFFYSIGYKCYAISAGEKKSHSQMLVENFLSHVQQHYREHRDLQFYANKLCITPKHLSRVIKKTSGVQANEWIENRVKLEAKALLKSTNMTIQQISDELNFPSQSFFGKYFKRVEGVSPKVYRGKP
jgi:AraC-like DNA-binding protein